MDTSFIFPPYYPPPPCARVSAFSTSLRLLPPTAASPRSAILGTPTISFSSSLFPSFPLRLRRRRLDRERKPGLASPFPPPLFLFVSLIFRLFPQRLHFARPLYPPTSLFRSLCSLYIFFLLSLLLHLNRLQYFGNYSRLVPLVLFFRPETYLYYSPFSFRLYLHSIIDECESNCEKPANEYDAHGYMSISSFYLAFNCRSVKGT